MMQGSSGFPCTFYPDARYSSLGYNTSMARSNCADPACGSFYDSATALDSVDTLFFLTVCILQAQYPCPFPLCLLLRRGEEPSLPLLQASSMRLRGAVTL